MDAKPANPFAHERVGDAYHRYRPRYHHFPVSRLASQLRARLAGAGESLTPLSLRVLDVACGTGHSTAALAEAFAHVEGCDASAEMLRVARQSNETRFVESAAEATPYHDSEFDLITVFMGFHWLEQRKFLVEARRLLKRPGYLAIDDYGFGGIMPSNAEFQAFYRAYYFKAFPAPYRNSDALSPADMLAGGFKLLDDYEYSHTLELTLEAFVSFLKTQSSLLAAARTADYDIGAHLNEKFAPYFGNRAQPLRFGGTIKLYQAL